MALVANYDSDSNDIESDENNTADNSLVSKENENVVFKSTFFMQDDFNADEPTSTASIFSSLPSSNTNRSNRCFIDSHEDLTSIPVSKSYDNNFEVRSKRKKGPIRLILPKLSSLETETDETSLVNDIRTEEKGNLNKKSRLLGLLPQPKNTGSKKSNHSLLLPYSLEKKSFDETATKQNGQAIEDDTEFSGSFFFSDDLEQTNILPDRSLVSSQKIQLAPEVLENRIPEVPVNSDVVTSYPPTCVANVSHSDNEDLLQNAEALAKLSGGRKSAMSKETLIEKNFVEVHQDNLTADTEAWVRNALDDNEEGKPGPRCTIKGQSKRKHQITYLAAMAKENEHKLKQQWAQNAANRRASKSKYGF